jgi:hypothetical protein
MVYYIPAAHRLSSHLLPLKKPAVKSSFLPGCLLGLLAAPAAPDDRRKLSKCCALARHVMPELLLRSRCIFSAASAPLCLLLLCDLLVLNFKLFFRTSITQNSLKFDRHQCDIVVGTPSTALSFAFENAVL